MGLLWDTLPPELRIPAPSTTTSPDDSAHHPVLAVSRSQFLFRLKTHLSNIPTLRNTFTFPAAGGRSPSSTTERCPVLSVERRLHSKRPVNSVIAAWSTMFQCVKLVVPPSVEHELN